MNNHPGLNHMMRAKIAVALFIGCLLSTGTAISYGWQIVVVAGALVWLIVLAVLAVRALRRANRQAAQIFDDELDDPDPFNERLRPVFRDDHLYDLTVNRRDSESEPEVYRGITRAELLHHLAQHDITVEDSDIRGRHTFTGGLQLAWDPSTTDTTGETR